MKFSVKNIVFLVLLIACFLIGATVLSANMEKSEALTYGDLLLSLEKGEVHSLEIDNSFNATFDLYTYEKEDTKIYMTPF